MTSSDVPCELEDTDFSEAIEMWGRPRGIILACKHTGRCLLPLPPRAASTSSSTHVYTLSLPGMQPRLTYIAAAGGAQAVCFYDLTLGG